MIYDEKHKILITGHSFDGETLEMLKGIGVTVSKQPSMLEESYHYIENRKKKNRKKNKKSFGRNKR